MTEDKQIFVPKTSKTILFAIGCLAFIIIGIMMKDKESLIGWMCVSFFGLGFIIFLIQLIPGSTQLTLTKEGFMMTSLFRSHFTKWSDVKEFKIGYMGRKKAVMFDYTDSHTKHEIGKSISKSLSGSHGALPSDYGLKATELVNIMNDRKNKYSA